MFCREKLEMFNSTEVGRRLEFSIEYPVNVHKIVKEYGHTFVDFVDGSPESLVYSLQSLKGSASVVEELGIECLEVSGAVQLMQDKCGFYISPLDNCSVHELRGREMFYDKSGKFSDDMLKAQIKGIQQHYDKYVTFLKETCSGVEDLSLERANLLIDHYTYIIDLLLNGKYAVNQRYARVLIPEECSFTCMVYNTGMDSLDFSKVQKLAMNYYKKTDNYFNVSINQDNTLCFRMVF